jgi:phage-related protein
MTETLTGYKAILRSRPKITLRRKISKFGNGYAQRVKDGLNTVERMWTVVFILTAAQKDAWVAFIDSKGGSEVFYYTPPGESSPLQFVCGSYDGPSPISGNLFEIVAEFEQDFTILAP